MQADFIFTLFVSSRYDNRERSHREINAHENESFVSNSNMY